HLDDGAVGAEGRPSGMPGREKRCDGGAAPCDLRVERHEPRAVWEVAAGVEGAERDLALNDPGMARRGPAGRRSQRSLLQEQPDFGAVVWKRGEPTLQGKPVGKWQARFVTRRLAELLPE